MEENRIIDTWMLFREYLDKKQIEIVAEKYIDMLADYGVDEESLTNALGSDGSLDEAIRYYLDLDGEDEEDY